MYMMPLSFLQLAKRFGARAVLVLFIFICLTGVDASAQGRRRRPATGGNTQQQVNANTAAQQQKPPQKKIAVRSTETADGSQITIRGDSALSDYSAYRSGDHYYVYIPDASAAAAVGGLRGRGFEDVKAQKQGNDVVLSFKLQPGMNARVSQRFNNLNIEVTAPGKEGQNTPPTNANKGTPQTANTGTTTTTNPLTTPTPRPTPQARINSQTNPATGINGQTTNPTLPNNPSVSTNPSVIPPTASGSPAVGTTAPSPEVSVSPSINPEANPSATPAGEEIAQSQQPPAPATNSEQSSSSSTSSSTLGAILQQNWLIILIGAIVLGSLVLIVAARSRAQRTAATPARRARRERKRAASEKAVEELPKADTSSAVTAASSATAVAAAKPDVDMEAIAAGVIASEAVKPGKVEEASVATEIPIAAEETTKELEVAPPVVDAERVDTAVKHLLAGEAYDEAVIGAHDAGTRQLVATELLSALAARNVERRERAREAFIKHDYLDEATKSLRTADAPAERAAAARALGYVKDRSTTPHLVAALEDEAPEVRRASVEALADLHDPAAVQPLHDLLVRERDRKVPKNLIKNAIEASTLIEAEETPTLEAEPPTLEAEPPSVDAADVAQAEVAPTEVAPTEVASTEVAGELVTAAAPLVVEEVVTAEDEAAARRQAEEAARQHAEEEEQRRAEEERLRAEAEARVKAEAEEARQQAEAEARRIAEAEAQRQAEEERLRAEAEAQRLAEEEAQRQAEEEAARLHAEEEARLRAEEEARLKAEEDARQLAALEAEKRQAEEAARQQAEEEARQQAEEEARGQAEAERLRLEEEARQRAEAEAAQKRAEEEAAARRAAEEEARRKAEEEERLRAEEAARQQAEEERQRAAEAARLAAEAEALAKAEEEARQRAEEEQARRRAEEEAAALVASEPALFDEPEAAHHATPVQVQPVEEEIIPELEPEEMTFEPALETTELAVHESKWLEPVSDAVVQEPATTKEITFATTEKGIAALDEFSTVPGAVLKRLSSEEPTERAAAVTDLARVGGDDSFREISAAFDDPAVEVRNAAARSLFNLNADRAATFTRALRESPPERRRKIGSALASSGLASEAIGQLMGESREKTYDAFSLLFLMSKAGEVQPLMRAIEEHPNNEVRLAVVKLLALSGQQEILPAFRRLAVRGSLPTEVRSAVMEAIYQISSQSTTAA
jgi:hypothetical protein